MFDGMVQAKAELTKHKTAYGELAGKMMKNQSTGISTQGHNRHLKVNGDFFGDILEAMESEHEAQGKALKCLKLIKDLIL
jgi:hypothetical protein